MDAFLSLFPLNVVLFPGMVLPLHIFEPRYRLMIARCLEREEAFGVALIREGPEVGGPADPYRVGTTARIVQVERLPDERMNLLAVGVERFQIRALDHRAPYLAAFVEPFPLTKTDVPDVRPLSLKLAGQVEAYLSALSKRQGAGFRPNQIPNDPSALAFFAATVLRLPPPQKQPLLEIPALPDFLARLLSMFPRELSLLQYLSMTAHRQRESGPSLN